jgi:hypothetical protein
LLAYKIWISSSIIEGLTYFMHCLLVCGLFAQSISYTIFSLLSLSLSLLFIFLWLTVVIYQILLFKEETGGYCRTRSGWWSCDFMFRLTCSDHASSCSLNWFHLFIWLSLYLLIKVFPRILLKQGENCISVSLKP